MAAWESGGLTGYGSRGEGRRRGEGQNWEETGDGTAACGRWEPGTVRRNAPGLKSGLAVSAVAGGGPATGPVTTLLTPPPKSRQHALCSRIGRIDT